DIFQNLLIYQVWNRHFEPRTSVHLPTDRFQRTWISRPSASCDSVVDIVEKHRLQPSFRLWTSVQHQSKTSVDHLAPTDSATVVDGDPSGSAKTISDHIVDSHVRGE